MEKHQLRAIIDRYLSGQSSPEEDALLQKLIEDSGQPNHWDTASLGSKERLREKMLARLKRSVETGSAPAELNELKSTRFSIRYRWLAAAVMLTAISIGFWFYVNREQVSGEQNRYANQELLQPGGDKASLQLSDGQVLQLDSSRNGAKFQRLASDAVAATSELDASPNILTTPRGGQFKLALPDGTLVWLNSESRLTFPSQFLNGKREVRLEGEAYFEVTPDADQPFIVHTAHTSTKVLGTHFNVRAYPGAGQVSTTLMEGAVEVQAQNQRLLLTPGYKANFDLSNQRLVQSEADLDATLGWKNGYFIFNDQNIKDIMAELARWYDAEVVYQGDLKSKDFSARISKRKNIKEILDLLEMTYAIRFKIEERRITVMP